MNTKMLKKQNNRSFAFTRVAVVFVMFFVASFWVLNVLASSEGEKDVVMLTSTVDTSVFEIAQPEHVDLAAEVISEKTAESVDLVSVEDELISALRMGMDRSLKPKYEQADNWQTVHMCVTAYCPCVICCGKHSDGVTASMHQIQQGDVFVAADKAYSFGTEMIIPGYNNGHAVTVEDRGRVIKGNKLDIFFNSHSEAQQWGVKYLDVRVRVE